MDVRRRLTFAASAALAIVVGWSCAGDTGADANGPPAGARGLQAFVLTGAPDSLADLQAHAADIGVVYPTDWKCEPGSGRVVDEGEGTGESKPGGDLAENKIAGKSEPGGEAGAIAAYANAHGIAVMPRFVCRDGQTVHTILTDPRVRARTLATLEALAGEARFAGVNLDLENDGAADRGAMTAFVRALAKGLHREGRRLSVDVAGIGGEDPRAQAGFYDERAIAAAADWMFVMAWGTHWEGSSPGPIAPLSYVAAVARFAATLPHARERVVLGVPMYGLDWAIRGPGVSESKRPRASPATQNVSPAASAGPAVALQYAGVQALIRATAARPVDDRAVDEPTLNYTRARARHQVWYMDAQSIADRIQVAREYGLRAGVWRLGEEDQALWSAPGV